MGGAVGKCFKAPVDGAPLLPDAPNSDDGSRVAVSRRSVDGLAPVDVPTDEVNGEVNTDASSLAYLEARPGLKVNMTPVRQTHEAQRIEHTPFGPEREVYKYYCPLCMFYLKRILQADCCKNYTCSSCAVQFLRSKGAVDDTCVEVPAKPFDGVPCPHCNQLPLQFNPVLAGASVRVYEDSPSIAQRIKAGPEASPLKASDSLADVQRKLLKFDDVETKPSAEPATAGIGFGASPTGFAPDLSNTMSSLGSSLPPRHPLGSSIPRISPQDAAASAPAPVATVAAASTSIPAGADAVPPGEGVVPGGDPAQAGASDTAVDASDTAVDAAASAIIVSSGGALSELDGGASAVAHASGSVAPAESQRSDAAAAETALTASIDNDVTTQAEVASTNPPVDVGAGAGAGAGGQQPREPLAQQELTTPR